MQVYNYDPVTGEYLGAMAVELDQIDSLPLVPAYATLIAPPVLHDHEAAVWNGADWRRVADWRGYAYWLDDGSRHIITELAIVPPAGALHSAPEVLPSVPVSVTRFQARAALMQAGLLAAVEAEVANSEDPLTVMAWADTTVWPRNSPTIAALAAAIGLSDAETDQLFIAASRITA